MNKQRSPQSTITNLYNNGWHNELLKNENGAIKPLLANAVTILRNAPECQDVLGFNDFSNRIVYCAVPPWAHHSDEVGTTWDDTDKIRAADWFQRQRLMINPNVADQAVQMVAKDNTFHPVRDYLQALEWDGVERVSTWLTTYFGADDNEYTRTVGLRWLVAAVARVMVPGEKVDNILVLEGEQNLGKSRAMKILCGEEWFKDHLPDIKDKDARLQLLGTWILEIAELDGLSKADTNKVKAFLSAERDRFRPPYGQHVIDVPRQCVFVATVNLDEYLRDETGNRRFWPVLCYIADYNGISAIRDQLWAEAYELYKSGQKWWLDEPELITTAREQQAQRYEGDPWDDLIYQYIDGRPSVSISEVLRKAIKKPTERWDQRDRRRIGKILRSYGWQRRQLRIDGKPERRFYPNDDA